MRRPLVLVGFTYLLTLAAAVYFGAHISMILAIACLAGFAVTLCFPTLRKIGVFPLALLTMSIAFSGFSSYTEASILPAEQLDQKDAVMEGVICEAPYRAYGRTYYVLEVRSIEGLPELEPFKIRMSSRHALNAGPYDHVKGKVHLYLPEDGSGFSSRDYYASKGIVLSSFLYEYEPVSILPATEKPLYYYALQARETLLKSVKKMLPGEEGEMINGVMLGDKTNLSSEVMADFRTVGVSHLLSVSGLHMSTMAGLFLLILSLLHVPRRIASAVAMAGVLGFMMITCFVPSVVRSGFMYLIFLSGSIFSRRADSLNSLGIAVFIIGILNPYAAADVGLLLSFFATLGLILLAQRVTNWMDERMKRPKILIPLYRAFSTSTGTTAGAVLFTLPVVILSFRSVTLVSLLANFLMLVPCSLMIYFAGFAVVFNLIIPGLGIPFALIAGLLAKYLKDIAHWMAQIPFATVSASYGFVLLWLAGTMVLVAVTLVLMKNRRLFRATAVLSAIVLLVGIFSFQLSRCDVTRISVIDSGTGTAVLATRNGAAALIGCGGYSSEDTASYLRGQGVQKLDYLQPLSQSREESKNLSEIMSAFSPGTLLLQEQEYLDDFIRKELTNAEEVLYYQKEASVVLWEGTVLEVRSVGEKCAVRIVSDGMTVLICPEGIDLSNFPDEWMESDVVILSDLPAGMERLRPFYTVYSVDEEDLQMNFTKVDSLGMLVTAGKGNLVLQIPDSRELQIRREV